MAFYDSKASTSKKRVNRIYSDLDLDFTRNPVTGDLVKLIAMGNGSWIMAGPQAGNNIAFGSSCHGAGRALSRSQAKKTLDGKALKRELEASGIRVHASTPNVLSEEAPAAYKNVDDVIRLTHEAALARPVARMNPLAVIKG